LKDKQSKKALKEKYMEREIIGGVYAIKNTLNNKLFLDATTDITGMKNRFEFSQKTGSCIHVKLQSDWSRQGGGQFVFEVLEELIKGSTQTSEGFKDDVNFLKDIWLEKLSGADLY
jgi:hypothetical protein